ncbi:MAG: ABC transporter permease [Acidobacteria bacterium]|nr:ABC transporter permease [Acidobacteriota bacterium]
MQKVLQDLRYATRMLLKSPGITLIAVLSIALGIGANTAIFSLVNAAFLRQLPVVDPQQLVYVFGGTRNSPWSVVSYPNYVDYRDRNVAFNGLAAFSGVTVSLGSSDTPDMIGGSIVTGNYFDLLGVRAVLGRIISPEDDKVPNAHPVVVISHRLWQQRFGARTEIVGQQLALNGHSFTVIGVTPAGFEGAEILETNDIYVPMMMQAIVRPPRGGFSGEMNPDLLQRRGPSWLRMIGRLKDGMTIDQAQAGFSILAAQLEQTYPNENRERTATLFPVSKIDPRGYRPLLSAAALLMAVVGVVLLIACANVANLLLARASARRREIAVRLALGASRARLVRQLLTESLLLALLGGMAGLLLGVWTVELLKATPPPTGIFSFNLDFSLDSRVLLFTLGLSLLTGIIFGLAPALQTSRPDMVPALKDESQSAVQGRRRFNLRNMLVVAQVALSLLLLIGAGLFLRSLRQMQGIDPGFDAGKILAASLNINLLRYTRPQGREFYRQVVERIESLPGVQSASLARVVPISGGGRVTNFVLEGQTGPERGVRSEGTGVSGDDNLRTVATNVVGLKYFQTMGIAMIRGRDFNAQDDEGTPGVVIINEAFARRHFINQDPLGKRLRLGGSQSPWREIIGIVRDSKYRAISEEPTPFIYQPLAQNHETGMTLFVRAVGDPLSVAGGVRREVNSLEKNLPLSDLQSLTTLLDSSLYPARMGAVLIVVFGLLALLLAGVGLYGVMSYSISQRTREIGVRMALGAQKRDVLFLVLKEGMLLVSIGVILGLIAALAVTHLLAGFLYGISATDAVTFAGIPAVLAVVALCACYLPARRATKVDPMVALRYG